MFMSFWGFEVWPDFICWIAGNWSYFGGFLKINVISGSLNTCVTFLGSQNKILLRFN